MSDIPRHILQKCEQRWARRFSPQVLASRANVARRVARIALANALTETPVLPAYGLSRARHPYPAPGGHMMTRNDGMPFNLSEVDVELADGTVRVPERANDSGSQANETVDGLDPETEALRHATEDTPTGAVRENIDNTPVFDRGDAAETI